MAESGSRAFGKSGAVWCGGDLRRNSVKTFRSISWFPTISLRRERKGFYFGQVEVSSLVRGVC